jgi:DNA invertase Pin-like site-specific DNA recombinase
MSTAAYLRVSSDDQESERQREAILRLGLSIDHWYEDSVGHNPRDKAATRPDFQRLLKHVKSGLIDTIVVASLDRFGVKDAYEMGAFFTLLREHGCRLLDATGKELNAVDDATVITSTVGALTSSREQREKAGRVLTGKLTRAREGEFQGGRPPYGFDVVCFGPDGKEKWRVVHEGHNKRKKLYTDGREERFDGRKNRPAKDPADVFRLRPSRVSERVKTLKQIFKWFAEQAVTPGQIAERLNDLDISPVFGPMWHPHVIRVLLANPVVIGCPKWNKCSYSRFAEFCDGQVRSIDGNVKSTRKRDHSDRIGPEQREFKPLVSQKTWDRVQAKLEASGANYRAPKRPPRTAQLWLRGFVYCWKCGKPMRGRMGSDSNGMPPGYCCSSYARWGPKNPTGCRQHHVPHDFLEAQLLDYLAETAPKLQEFLEATEASDFAMAKPLITALLEVKNTGDGIGLDMLAFVEDHMEDDELAEHFKGRDPIQSAYGILYEKMRPRLEEQIAEGEAQLSQMLDDFRDLAPELKPLANEKMIPLQARLHELRQRLTDLRVPYRNLRDELIARQEALEKAVATLNTDGQYRQKNEALRGVIDRIVCQFTYQNENGKPLARTSRLKSVEIAAADGGSETTPQSECRLSAFACAPVVSRPLPGGRKSHAEAPRRRDRVASWA